MRVMWAIVILALSFLPVVAQADDHKTAKTETTVNGFKLKWRGFIRTRYRAILNDPDESDFIGGNDGFSLDNARLAATIQKKD